MKIWLYTVTHNEAKILPFFLRHYESFCDRITVFDDNSTDGTPDLVRACKVGVVEKYPYDDGLDDRKFIQLARDNYVKARGHADWVIWCDPDEFLYHPNLVATLEKLLKDGVQVPLTRGFQMLADKFPVDDNGLKYIIRHKSLNKHVWRSKSSLGCMLVPNEQHPELKPSEWVNKEDAIDVMCTTAFGVKNLDLEEKTNPVKQQLTSLITEGVEDPTYAKPVIFQPQVDMQWEPGKHYVHGNFTRGGDIGLKVLHYRFLGLDYLRERHTRNYARCSKANKDSGLGVGVYPGHQGHGSEAWFQEIFPRRQRVFFPNKFEELIQSIHVGINPYAGYLESPAKAPVSHWGQWGSDHPWIGELVEKVRPNLIIEVGSFLGGSAIAMGEKLKSLGLNQSALLCVDTWLAEEILWSRAEHRDKLRIQFGTPTFYYTFLSNIIDRELSDTVVPLRMPSVAGARYLAMLGITAEMIYIDGSHIEGDVIRDLDLYWDRLAPGGVMLVDDYLPDSPHRWMFEGVIRDVQKFAAQRGLKVEADGNKARLWKAKA